MRTLWVVMSRPCKKSVVYTSIRETSLQKFMRADGTRDALRRMRDGKRGTLRAAFDHVAPCKELQEDCMRDWVGHEKPKASKRLMAIVAPPIVAKFSLQSSIQFDHLTSSKQFPKPSENPILFRWFRSIPSILLTNIVVIEEFFAPPILDQIRKLIIRFRNLVRVILNRRQFRVPTRLRESPAFRATNVLPRIVRIHVERGVLRGLFRSFRLSCLNVRSILFV